MPCKITQSRVFNKQIAPKGKNWLVFNFSYQGKKYSAGELILNGTPGHLKGAIALRLFQGMQKKYGFKPSMQVVKRNWFERLIYKINKLWKRMNLQKIK